MATFEDPAPRFQKQVGATWRDVLAPDYRIWILWYEHTLERRDRRRLHGLEGMAHGAGHGWRHIDLAPEFGRWVAQQEYFEGLLEMPEELESILPAFAKHLAAGVRAALAETVCVTTPDRGPYPAGGPIH